MKNLIIVLGMIISASSFAAVNTSVDIQVGTGEYICTAEGIDKNPSLVRANSMTNAKDLAVEQCADIEGSDFFCKVTECAQDQNQGNINMNIWFSVNRSGTNIDINLNSGVAGVRCRTKAFMNRYKATAPTRLEAEILVKKTCIADGNHGMHCSDTPKCVNLENRSSRAGRISTKDKTIDIEGMFDIYKEWMK